MTRYIFWNQIPERRFVDVTVEDIDGEAVELVSDSAYDVTGILAVHAAIKASDGNAEAGVSYVTNNDSVPLWDDGTNVLTLTVNADGSAEVRRTAGSLSFDATLRMLWI